MPTSTARSVGRPTSCVPPFTRSWWHSRQWTERARVARGDEVHELEKRPNTRTVVVGVEVRDVEENAADSRTPRADDVHVVQVADVHHPPRLGRRTRERDAEDARIRLLVADLRRVDDVVDVWREADAIERGAEPPVRVRHHDETEAEGAQPLQRRDRLVTHVLPEVLARVIRA